MLFQAKEEVGPEKQTVLCGGITVMDVIMESSDMEGREDRGGSGAPRDTQVDVVRRPTPKYVLIIETSAAMDRYVRYSAVSVCTILFCNIL